jgi:hypothetical protein
MKWLTCLLTALLPLAAFPQKSTPAKPAPFAQVDALSEHWPDSVTGTVEGLGNYARSHFAKPTERTRAIFVWIADNIQYDVDNMFALDFYEEHDAKISKALRTRKGICENYAALFEAVCKQAGISCMVVEGYTKQRGFVDFIPHAWCAAVLDSSWWLFDPTWGSGYISQGKFVRKMNDDYFKAAPAAFIKSHMPFDYLWQFLYYPVTNQEFYEGKTVEDKSKPYFSYPDSINVWMALSPVKREAAEAVRVEKNGVRNSLVFDRLRHLKMDIENNRQQEMVDSFNTAVADYNAGIKQLNVFINYRNEQFKPAQPDSAIQRMLDSADVLLHRSKTGVAAVVTTDADAKVRASLQSLRDAIDSASAHVKEQQDWLKTYFSKSKMGRKNMFYKVTLFGKPIN